MLATSLYTIVFRIVHIAAAVAWGGSVLLLVVFVQPSSAAIGPAAAPFMGELLGRRRVVDWILTMGALTIAGGLFLYWRDWHLAGTFGDWISSRFGLVLTIGAVAAIAAFAIGAFGTRPGVQRLLALGRRAAEEGGPPSPELAEQIRSLQGRLKTLSRASLGLIAIAVLAMSTARYW